MKRLEPILISGKAWTVQVAERNRKKDTKRTVLISDPVYTLAQTQTFYDNNRTENFSHLLEEI